MHMISNQYLIESIQDGSPIKIPMIFDLFRISISISMNKVCCNRKQYRILDTNRAWKIVSIVKGLKYIMHYSDRFEFISLFQKQIVDIMLEKCGCKKNIGSFLYSSEKHWNASTIRFILSLEENKITKIFLWFAIPYA